MRDFLYYALPYYLGMALFMFYLVMLIITGVTFARQKNSTAKPNEYLSDRLVFYSNGFTKQLKILTLITASGYVVLLPTAIAYGIGRLYLEDQVLVVTLIAFVVGISLMFLIAQMPFCFKETCLVVDEQKLTVKYGNGEMGDKVFYVSNYDHYRPGRRNFPPSLIFKSHDGQKEILSLHFLRILDAVTVGNVVEFIKRNGSVPVIRRNGSKQEVGP